MTEMQAAIGNVALPKVDGWIHIRRRLAAILDDQLSGHPAIQTYIPEKEFEHAYYKYYFLLSEKLLSGGRTRQDVLQAMSDAGIPVFAGICSEIYAEGVFKNEHPSLAIARELGERAVMIPLHPGLDKEIVVKAATRIRAVLTSLVG